MTNRSSFIKNKNFVMTAGFTIAELIVVIAIFSIITTVALLDQNRLNSSVLITNLAYETALSIREAQVYGVGVRNFSANTQFGGQFGVYFNINNPDQVVLFNDKDSNYQYDSGEAEYLYSFTNQRGNKIKALCLGDLSGSPCTPISGPRVLSLRILFKRPALEAMFFGGDTGPNSSGPAYIVVDDVDGSNCRAIIVEQTGQIRVEKASDVSRACQ